jgi:predicted transcriptional regulator
MQVPRGACRLREQQLSTRFRCTASLCLLAAHPSAVSSDIEVIDRRSVLTADSSDWVVVNGPVPRITRSVYLLDGRRVTVADLFEFGLLRPGDSLRFERVRLGETHHAVVAANGRIVLDDGQAFSSPSRAAIVAAGVRSLDGWRAWVEELSGRTLDSLRQELLDVVAAQAMTGQPIEEEGDEEWEEGNENEESARTSVPAPQRRHQFLKDARIKAESGDPEEVTVRKLLELWGAGARGYRISQRIEADLANHDLVTVPSFRKVTLDTAVQLSMVPDEGAEISDDIHEAVDDAAQPAKGLTIGNLPSAFGAVASVPPTATFEHAITVMLLNDYSQLAVVEGQRKLRGAISWKSIAQARQAHSSAKFTDAIIEANVVRYDKELRDVLPILEASDFVFVRDANDVIAGIVTTADVVHAYGELATPFFLIGELDQALRQVISRTFTIGEVTSLCDPDGSRKIESFDDLSMGDYQRVLENPDLWDKLGWPLERTVFIRRLSELREIRNDVMHFNPDPLPLDAVNKLRHAINVLREYGD